MAFGGGQSYAYDGKIYLATFGKNVFFWAISRFPLQADVWPPFSGGLGEGVAQDAGFMSFGVEVRHRELGRHPGCILQRDRAKGGFGEGGEMGLSGCNVG